MPYAKEGRLAQAILHQGQMCTLQVQTASNLPKRSK
jgi:hypothetical protein